MLYQSASKPAPETRQLDPYALAFRWGWWYVVGYCHTRRELRTFRLDRIQELTVLKLTFQAPASFDARAYMEDSTRGQPQVLARLKFTRAAAQVARLNRLFWSDSTEQADGSLLVTLAAPDLDWAASTILLTVQWWKCSTHPNYASWSEIGYRQLSIYMEILWITKT
jgi:proteasome accessory factor C